MKRRLKGNCLPESHADAQHLFAYGVPVYRQCVGCGKALNAPDAANSPAGWRETQISGECEPCFDALFEGMEEAE